MVCANTSLHVWVVAHAAPVQHRIIMRLNRR
jgi:hypothetical protein